jgi:hypothetical protein
MLKRAGYHSFHAWMPRIVALRRHGHGDHARRSRRHDQVGVAAPDIDRACLQRHRTAHFDHLKLALTIEPFGKRTGEARRHMLRNQHRAGKPERQLRQHDVERGRAAGRGPDQHQSQRRVGLACRRRRALWWQRARQNTRAPELMTDALGQPQRSTDSHLGGASHLLYEQRP